MSETCAAATIPSTTLRYYRRCPTDFAALASKASRAPTATRSLVHAYKTKPILPGCQTPRRLFSNGAKAPKPPKPCPGAIPERGFGAGCMFLMINRRHLDGKPQRGWNADIFSRTIKRSLNCARHSLAALEMTPLSASKDIETHSKKYIAILIFLLYNVFYITLTTY